jgi:hypothetical protein
MDGVKSLVCSPNELPGVEGAERSDGGDGNWGGPTRPKRRVKTVEEAGPITGEEPGSGAGAGRASEAAVVPLESDGQHNHR